MANIIDYLKWRGDLLFSQDPPNEIDALIFSTIVYLQFSGSVLEHPEREITVREAAAEFLALDDYMSRVRGKNDAVLIRWAAQTERFGQTRITGYSSQFDPEQQTQFAAATFLLDDGSGFIAYRGTDNTLTGWKEDFNMSFQQTIPAQRIALRYANEIHARYTVPLRLCGHSKGGNLAVFAAAQSTPEVQKQILSVYNYDGPGFSSYMMGDTGYLAMVPRIFTFVPQSSIVGMIMEREEPISVIKSSQVGPMQHDVFSWEVMGKEFTSMDGITADSIFVNQTLKNWMSGMTNDERSRMVDVLFSLLESGDVNNISDVFHPKNLHRYLRTIGADAETRKVLYDDLHGLFEAARLARSRLGKNDMVSEQESEESLGSNPDIIEDDSAGFPE